MVRLEAKSAADILDPVAQAASDLGMKVYAVGGYVRDLYMGNESGDIDFVVVGDALKFAKHFRRAFHSGKVVTFPRFGTAMVTFRDQQLEFVTARSESYNETSRKPIVKPADLESDLSRRDFTINCLAMDISTDNRGAVIDVFDGVKDIEAGIIRTPLDPELTFSDDPLRMLRALRFAARFDFEIEDATYTAIQKNIERLEIVSKERITEEFRKMMLANPPSRGLRMLRDSGLSTIVMPELNKLGGVEQRKEFHHKDVFNHTLQVVDNIAQKTDRFDLRLAALLHDIAKPQTKRFVEGIGWTFHGHEELGARMTQRIGRRMRLPMDTIKHVEKLVRLHLRPIQLVDDQVTDSAVRRMMFEAGDAVDDLMILCRADITSKNPRKVKRYLSNFDKVESRMIEVEEKDRMRNFKPAISGLDIIEHLDVPPGPIIGEIKQAIVDAILDGDIPNEREACLEHFLKIKDDILAQSASKSNPNAKQ